MLQKDVKVGSVYAVKVNGNIVPVRITFESSRSGRRIGPGKYAEATCWRGVNLLTGREVYIRSAGKLRYEMQPDPAMSSRWIRKKEATE